MESKSFRHNLRVTQFQKSGLGSSTAFQVRMTLRNGLTLQLLGE